jgi:acetyl-CoA carboxylase biotin carboxylase subunit
MRRILIANRGEIAVRIIRACRRSGIESVAVFSDADRAALHVRMAVFAEHIGPSQPSESYLNFDKIIAAAKKSRADAIHPGYGFLSERAEFAQRVVDEGLIWIGPPPSAIALMGDKIAARRLMKTSGVPVVPGSDGPITDTQASLKQAHLAGFPILLKAVAGGGGKGMRLVENPNDWQSAFDGASREAERAFGDGRMYWEKYVGRPHHVEIQVLGGPYGRAISLFERECSIQRRHQKVIEESPSPIMTDDLRARMSRAAVAAAEACGYQSAGTVEFLVDDADRKFYFLEMNTRLQVEHPVTEAVTGVDLVIEQFKIASGAQWVPPKLPERPFGHAMEFRIYAEDPENNFLPSPGRLKAYRQPQGPGVRVDSGVYRGAEIPIYYDPMIAKLVVWGKDREEAMSRASAALEEYYIGGVATTIEFHRKILEHPEFRKGNTTTDFIPRFFGEFKPLFTETEDLRRAVALGGTLYTRRRAESHAPIPVSGSDGSPYASNWLRQGRVAQTQRWPVGR